MINEIINRPEYLSELNRHKGKTGLIKVVTGVRRCGKSTLLQIFQKKLINEKVNPNNIINISLEGIENEDLRNGKTLYKYIKDRVKAGQIYHVFIDEVQLAADFEEAVNSLRLLRNVDLYVTGSNYSIMTGRFATRWAGRYIEIRMLPLSFSEYASVFPKANPDILYSNYTIFSSFPEVFAYYEKPWIDSISGEKPLLPDSILTAQKGGWNKPGVHDYLDAIYNSILIRDVMLQHGVKEMALLERVIKCLFSNIGSETSINNMVNMLNNDLKMRHTDKNIYAANLENYIDALLQSFVFYKAERRFVKGREYLRTNAKYYAVDVAMRYYLLGSKGTDSGHLLENIVYLELLRRGYRVHIGKVGEKEVDFIAENTDGTEYYQVAETVRGRETLAREILPLNEINDHYPKFLLTRDHEPAVAHNGIRQLNVLHWLLGQSA